MRLVVAALTFILFVACDKQYEDLTLQEDLSVSGEVTLVASVTDDGGSTRVESNIWESDDFIGISTTNESEQNMLYSVEANGTMTNTDENVVIGVLDNNSYYGYYPYDKSLSDDGVKSISLLDQDLAESLTSYDFMWARQEGVGVSQPTVYLYFERQLVHLDVTFCLIDSSFDTTRSIKLSGVSTGATFNITTGELTPSESVGTINLNVKSIEETKITTGVGSSTTLTTIKAEAIVLPMSDSDIYFSYVTTEGAIVCIFSDVSWEKGYSYNYTISENDSSYSLSEIKAGSYPNGDLWIINDTQPTSSSEFEGLCAALEAASSTSRNIHLYLPNPTVLPNSAMSGCDGYFTLTMPSLTKINSSALQNCSNLSTVNAPNLEYVGDSAFNGCSALSDISTDNISIIDNYAFKGCSALAKLSFPLLLSTGTEAFSSCSTLTEFSAPLLSWVGDSMLSSSSMIAETKISIGYESERGITYLTKGWIDDDITGNIDLIISSILPSGVSVSDKTITYADGSTQTFNSIDNKALTLSSFSNDMDTSDMSNTTWTIVDYNSDSSDDFARLRDVLNSRTESIRLSFPYLENLPDDALKDCSNISYIELLSVESIGSGSLSGCSSLSEIVLGSTSNYISEIESGWISDVESEAIKLTINSGLSGSLSIEENRLYNDGSYIYFKTLNGDGFTLNSFKEMGDGALTYPNSTEWYITESGAPDSDEYNDLQDIMSAVGEPISLTFSDITTLSRDALSGTENLYKITLETATKVNYMALESCSSLEIIDMPNVTTVSSMAFTFCTKLKEVSLPSALVLGSLLFQKSTQMERLDVGSKIETSISSYDKECFYSMFNLDNIDFTICESNKFTSDMSVESNRLIFSSSSISDYKQYTFKSITQE